MDVLSAFFRISLDSKIIFFFIYRYSFTLFIRYSFTFYSLHFYLFLLLLPLLWL